MDGRRTLQDLVRESGITPERQACLPAPTQPAIISSQEDHELALSILIEQRKNSPHYQDPSKQLKRIFKSSKEKEKLHDTSLWQFSQEELDQALSSVIARPATNSGLIQAFLSLGAKVNFVETYEKKQKANKTPNTSARRRSTVLQRAATTRRADSVSLLASSGADQTTLDEGLRAALDANDYPCVQELLRHGADLNKFPNTLADAVRSNDQNFVRLLLRAPKALRPEIVSSCLPAAVQQKSEPMLSLLIGHGADPNFDAASALIMAISQREYRLAVALVAGPIPLALSSVHGCLDSAMKLPSAHELFQFLQLLFCCGLPPTSPRLAELLVAATKRNDSVMAHLLIVQGVPTGLNDAECLRHAIGNTNWRLMDEILEASVSPAQASVALAIVPAEVPQPERLHVITALVSSGANGEPLQRWLVRAVEDGDSALMDLLLNADRTVGLGDSRAIQAAVLRKDLRSLRTLLKSRPSSQSLARVFPFIRSGYTAPERLEVARMLLRHGAIGVEVDQALVDAVADTSSSRDVALITELVRHGANVNYEDGRALSLAVVHSDVPILRLLCSAKPSVTATSAAVPLSMSAEGVRRPLTLDMIELLAAHGIDEGPAEQALLLAIKGGPQNLDIVHRLIAADSRLLGLAFQHAIAIDIMQRKVPILKSLLTKGLPQDALDRALIVETGRVITSNDPTLLQLLMQNGASISSNDGESFAAAVESGNSALVKILLGGKDKPTQIATTRAFLALFYDYNAHHCAGNSRSCVEIAQELLDCGVDKPAIDSALCTVLDPVNQDVAAEPFVNLLLEHRADVNTSEGICFGFVAQRKDFELFEQLLDYRPDFASVVSKLMHSGLDDTSLLKLISLCIKRGCTSDDLERQRHAHPSHKPTLILALDNYPRSESLVRLLLTHGCNPNITLSDTIDGSLGEEQMSALIWALAQPQKRISSSVILALLDAGASPTRPTSDSELAPIALAAREGRVDIIQALLQRGADPSVRDKWNRSALFYASSKSVVSIVETLSAHALTNDGSLHEAARCLQLDVASSLIRNGHSPNFPSRLHSGRNALGELCLNAEVTTGSQRTKLRQLLDLLHVGANAKFRARNERSCIILALDNAHSALEITEAFLETEAWEDLNAEEHLYRDPATGLWYSPLKYVELMPSPSRTHVRQELLDLLRDKGCLPKYYSESEEQPANAVGMPAPIARLADRQKEHHLSLKLAAEASEHARMLEETAHRDLLRRRKEQSDAAMILASTTAAHNQALSQKAHDAEIARVQSAEAMKRSEKATWHRLLQDQDGETATRRQRIEDRRASASFAHESRLVGMRKEEVEYRAGVERRQLKEKEEVYDRNVKRQLQITKRVDESAELHARLRQERPAIEGAPQWGSVD